MDLQQENFNFSKDELGENSKSSPSTSSFNNLDTSQSVFEPNGLNQNSIVTIKHLYLPPMPNDQRFSVMDLKMSEYEKTLAEEDYTIKPMNTYLMNSQNNSHIPSNQCLNIIEKTKPANGTCVYQNSGFTNIYDRLNKLGDTVDNARTIPKDLIDLVKILKEKFLIIDDVLKQVSLDKTSTQQELETLESKCSLDMINCKFNLEKCTKENENFKTENYWLLEKLNQTNIRLNEEKEMALRLIQNYEKVLKEMDGQNVLLTSQNKSLNVKYEEILSENQSLKKEISIIKISLDENQNQLDLQLKGIKDQTELLDNLKVSKELNDALKKDNLSLKEHNEYLEKKHANFVEDFYKLKLSHQEIQEENERKFKDMCKKYDNLLKTQEEMFVEKTVKLQLQNEKECKILDEEIDLKQVVDDSSTNLTNANQKLQDLNPENITDINKVNKEKSELVNQCNDHFEQIKKFTEFTADCKKYKSEAKLCADVTNLLFQCSPTKQKNSHQLLPVETIDLLSDEDVNMKGDDCSIVKFNEKDITNIDVSIQSTSKKINQKNNYSSFKRDASPLREISNSNVKKYKTIVNNISSQFSKTPLKEKYDVNNESKNQVLKKIFKKSACKPSQKKSKPGNIQNINSSKQNSKSKAIDE